MITVFSKYIPFGNYQAMAVWPFLIARSDKNIPSITVQHELIHGEQQKELLLIGFWVVYVIAAIKELVHCIIDKKRGQNRKGTRNLIHRIGRSLIFEREAYNEEATYGYLKERRHYAWLRTKYTIK